MLSLEHLPGRSMMPLDWALLEKAMAYDYSGFDTDHLALELERQTSQLWLVVGAGTRLLVVTEVVALPSGKELHLRYIAGQGWFRHFQEILGLLEGLAFTFGCRWITGKLRGRHAETYYKRFGGVPNGVLVVKDLQNVQQAEISPDHHSERGGLHPAGFRSGVGRAH